MRTDKRKKLEAAGWRIGDTSEFLRLSEVESAYIETKLHPDAERTLKTSEDAFPEDLLL